MKTELGVPPILAGSLRRFVTPVFGGLLGLALLQVLFDPWSWVSDGLGSLRARLEFPQAVSRWNDHDVRSYRIRVRGSVPLTCLVDAQLSVRDGLLVAALVRENPLDPSSRLRETTEEEWDRPGCGFRDLTVERMFRRVEEALQTMPWYGAPMTVQFHREAGYVTNYAFGRAARGGVFGFSVSDCCSWYEFDGFEELAP